MRILARKLYLAAQAVASGQPGVVFEHFGAIGGYLENRGTKVDTHNHVIQFGFLALMLALVQPWVALQAVQRLRLARLFMVGAVIMPPSIIAIHYVGTAYSPFESIGWASVVTDLGGFLLILACLGFFVGLLRYAADRKTASSPALKSKESNMLLRGGAVMLMTGFLYGAWYAASDFERLQEQELIILDAIVENAAIQEMSLVDESFESYGVMAAEKAVKIAAHAHINEVGMMALLLAFVQHLVFLSDKWRRRWAGLFMIGAIGLPVSIFAELRFWPARRRFCGYLRVDNDNLIVCDVIRGTKAYRETRFPGGRAMSTSQRIMVIGGLMLAIMGMSYGLWYAVYDEHQTLERMGVSLASSFAAGAQRDMAAAQQALVDYGVYASEYDREIHAHAHWITLGFLWIVIGIAFSRVSYAESTRLVLAIALVAGAFAFPLGIFLESYTLNPITRLLTYGGSAAVLLGMAVITVGLFRTDGEDTG